AGQQRVEQAAERQLHPRIGVQGDGLLQHGLPGFAQPRPLLPHDLRVQPVLAAEMVVDHALVDPGCGHDVLHPGAPRAVLGELPRRGGKEDRPALAHAVNIYRRTTLAQEVSAGPLPSRWPAGPRWRERTFAHGPPGPAGFSGASAAFHARQPVSEQAVPTVGAAFPGEGSLVKMHVKRAAGRVAAALAAALMLAGVLGGLGPAAASAAT